MDGIIATFSKPQISKLPDYNILLMGLQLCPDRLTGWMPVYRGTELKVRLWQRQFGKAQSRSVCYLYPSGCMQLRVVRESLCINCTVTATPACVSRCSAQRATASSS